MAGGARPAPGSLRRWRRSGRRRRRLRPSARKPQHRRPADTARSAGDDRRPPLESACRTVRHIPLRRYGIFAPPSPKVAAGQGSPLPNRLFPGPLCRRRPLQPSAVPMTEPHAAELLQHANPPGRAVRTGRAAEGDALLLRADGLQPCPYRQPANLCVRGPVAAHAAHGGLRPAPCDERHRCRPSGIGCRRGRRQDDAGGGARAQIALGHRPLLRGRVLPPQPT